MLKLKGKGRLWFAVLKEAILTLPFLQERGRESGLGLALIRQKSYFLEVRYVSVSVAFVFYFPQTYTHIPKVS